MWVCPADHTSWAVESGREVCRVRKSPAYRRIDREVCVERSGDRGWSPSGRYWGLRTSPGRSVSPFLVNGDTRSFWVTEKSWRGYRAGKTSRVGGFPAPEKAIWGGPETLRGCADADARLSGRDYVYCSIWLWCKLCMCWYQCRISGGALHMYTVWWDRIVM